jgi:glycosyltransferase involved in cell wall biosynthesis/2-polyprenyl-3-methyl-5-hydroxy-6-metoxy-1,4-benzoquinol methylase
MSQPGLRLAFVTFEYAGVTQPVTGGVGNSIARLAPALAALGHHVEVFTLDPSTTGTTVSADVRIHRHRQPAYRNPMDALVGELRWKRTVALLLAARDDVDLVVAPDWGGHASSLAWAKRRAPLLTQLHSSGIQLRDYTEQPHWPSRLVGHLKNRSEIRQLLGSDAVAGVSSNVLADAMARLDLSGQDTFVLHNFLDVEEIRRIAGRPGAAAFADAQRSANGDAASQRTVMFFGNLVELKGVFVLVAAMREYVWPRHHDAMLVLAGAAPPGRESDAARRLDELAGHHRNRLELRGALPHDRLFPLIASADVVALPSLWEALPFSVLEAMAIGKPVVAAAGAGDLIEDGRSGLLVTPGNVPELGKTIARLLDDAELSRKLAHHAARRAEQFDVSEGAPRASDAFQRVAARWRENPERRTGTRPAPTTSRSGETREVMRQDPNSEPSRAIRRAELERAWTVEHRERIEFLMDAARNKYVLDLGCVDHSPEAMDTPSWLHRQIAEVASRCVGADYEAAAVERLRAAGFKTYVADVTKPPTDELRSAGPFEVIIAGELIEHLGAPQALFAFAHALLEPCGRLVITTPNPYAPVRVRSGQIRIFWESTDHVTYLFPSGIAELASRTGMTLMLCTTVDRRTSPAVAKASIRDVAVAAMRRFLNLPIPDAHGHVDRVGKLRLPLGWGYLSPAEALLHWLRAPYGQLGETAIYVLERPGD